MKTTLVRMLIAAVLASAAWLSWSESRIAARVADAKQDIAALNHDHLDGLSPTRALSDYLPGDRRRLSDEIRIAKATVAYWLGRYSAVAADTDSGQADADIRAAPLLVRERLEEVDGPVELACGNRQLPVVGRELQIFRIRDDRALERVGRRRLGRKARARDQHRHNGGHDLPHRSNRTCRRY